MAIADEGANGLAQAVHNVLTTCRRLHTAIDALDQAAADMLGISRNDLRCLNLLEHGPMAPTRLGTVLGLTSGSMTSLVDRLEAKGLVERARDPAGRRGVLVSATPRVFESIGQLYRGCAQATAATVGAYPARTGGRCPTLGRRRSSLGECHAPVTWAGEVPPFGASRFVQGRRPFVTRKFAALVPVSSA